jgi:phosphate starvation-inducible PhoH-like protein
VEAGENLGFLPGDLVQKINPYLRPLYDCLFELAGPEQTRRLIDDGTIEIAPLAFMRGRTLSNSFIILDEAQNTTKSQMKMFLTRLGKKTKIAISGDITQIDLDKRYGSGLIQATKIFSRIPGIGLLKMQKEDISRHPLVEKIISAYEEAEKDKTS